MATIERKIFFYRLCPTPYDDGTAPDIDVADALAKIAKLKFLSKSTASSSRYMDAGASVVGAWPSTTRANTRVELARIRRDDLPSLENGGARKSLPVADGDGLSESTHIEFFDNNIVGAEFNFYGPRATAFSEYCEDKVPSLPKFKLRPLLHRDGITQLNDLEDIRLFAIRVHHSHANLLKAANKDLNGVLDSLSSQYGADSYEIIIRARRGKTLASGLIGAAKALWRSTKHPTRDFDMFHVKGTAKSTERVEEFDLLKDRFIQKASVEKLKKIRGVASESMYKAIAESYNDLKQELEAAQALGIEE